VALIVQKYGGTSVGDIAASEMWPTGRPKTRKEGNDVVVGVSAMSGETDRLIGSPSRPARRRICGKYDSLISRESR